MTRSRDKRPAYQKDALAAKAAGHDDDDAILGELVESAPALVSQRAIEKFAERDRDHEDLERFLQTINNFTKQQLELNREHAEKHPDAIEGRKTQNFRRLQYVVLLCMLPFILGALVYVTLPVATVLGIIGVLITSGVLVNGRDREMDLNGFVRMIHSIVGRREQR